MLVNKTLLILFLTLPLLGLCQKKLIKKRAENEDSVISKWNAATLSIEGTETYNTLRSERHELLIQGKITETDYKNFNDSLDKVTRSYSGTAIFLLHNQRYYLLTARHVVIDPSIPGNNTLFVILKLVEKYSTLQAPPKMYAGTDGRPTVRSPNILAPVVKGQASFHYLSSIEEDIALFDLSTNRISQSFKNSLLSHGYKPVTVNDIDTTKLIKGQKVIAIGYPAEATVASFKTLGAIADFASAEIKTPIVSRGEIFAWNDTAKTFNANIWVYHGNSGGPVISNNKLVGIASAVGRQPAGAIIRGMPEYYFWQSIFIKSALIFKGLRILESRL